MVETVLGAASVTEGPHVAAQALAGEGVALVDAEARHLRGGHHIGQGILVDVAKEKERLEKELARLEKELQRSRGMLSNEKFISKAPKEKVDEEKRKLSEYEKLYEQVNEQLKKFLD